MTHWAPFQQHTFTNAALIGHVSVLNFMGTIPVQILALATMMTPQTLITLCQPKKQPSRHHC